MEPSEALLHAATYLKWLRDMPERQIDGLVDVPEVPSDINEIIQLLEYLADQFKGESLEP
jgi:hypothetical protein